MVFEPQLFVRKPFCESGFAGRSRTDDDLRRLVPCGAGLQGSFELRHQGLIDDDARFEVQGPHLKNAFLAVGFGVEPTDQRIVVQNRQGEVAIFTPGRGRLIYLVSTTKSRCIPPRPNVSMATSPCRFCTTMR